MHDAPRPGTHGAPPQRSHRRHRHACRQPSKRSPPPTPPPPLKASSAPRALFLSGCSFSASLRYAAGAGRCRPRGRSAHGQAGRRGATVGTAERRPPAHPHRPTPPCAAPPPTLFHVVFAGTLGHPQYLVVARGGADACNQLPLLRRGLQMKEGRAAATAAAAAVSMLGGQPINLQNTQVQACSARASIRGEHWHHRRHSRRLPCGLRPLPARAACCWWPPPRVRGAAAGWARCPCPKGRCHSAARCHCCPHLRRRP